MHCCVIENEHTCCMYYDMLCCFQAPVLSCPSEHCVQFNQLPPSLALLVNLIAFSWEIRRRPISCVPLLREPQRHSFQDEIKMASVNPAFQLQAVTQRVSLGTGWDCSRERYSRKGRYSQILCSQAQCKCSHIAIICGLCKHGGAEINRSTNLLFVSSHNGSRKQFWGRAAAQTSPFQPYEVITFSVSQICFTFMVALLSFYAGMDTL